MKQTKNENTRWYKKAFKEAEEQYAQADRTEKLKLEAYKQPNPWYVRVANSIVSNIGALFTCLTAVAFLQAWLKLLQYTNELANEELRTFGTLIVLCFIIASFRFPVWIGERMEPDNYFSRRY